MTADQTYFSSLAPNIFEIYRLDPSNIPRHVAIIMDGNRRWAKQKGVPAAVGHWKGAEAVTQIVKMAADVGVKVLTVYAFSTENWMRPSEEVSALMLLFQTYLMQQKDSMVAEGIRLDAIGNLSQLPEDVQSALSEVKEATKGGERIELILALSYGGRDDILRAVKRIVADSHQGVFDAENLTERVFCSYLDTAKWPDPDLLIRTSGERRLSNFLLWQMSYTEVVVTDVLWPDFSAGDFVQAMEEYQHRHRRRGGV